LEAQVEPIDDKRIPESDANNSVESDVDNYDPVKHRTRKPKAKTSTDSDDAYSDSDSSNKAKIDRVKKDKNSLYIKKKQKPTRTSERLKKQNKT
jgi:hypothetical protein